jgi:lipoyl(octanoyl) transferase
VFDLGIAPFEPVQDLQTRLRRAVATKALPGVVLLLEHEPVITLGSRGALEDLCDPERVKSQGIPVIASERGGQVTLHAPGQLVSYLIVPIPRRDLRRFVHDLEEVLVVLLAGLGVSALRREGRPGLYVEGNKIASVGLRCHRWVASHGTSLNVEIDLDLFDLIVTCGEPGLRQTSMEAVSGRPYPMALVKELYLEAATRVFGWTLSAPRAIPYARVEAELGLEEAQAPS